MAKISYSGYRFPPEIIQQAIWLYLRFSLSFRDVEPRSAGSGSFRVGKWDSTGDADYGRTSPACFGVARLPRKKLMEVDSVGPGDRIQSNLKSFIGGLSCLFAAQNMRISEALELGGSQHA